MDFLDITAIWLSLAWIALAFAAAWLLNMVAERDSAASRPGGDPGLKEQP